MELTSKDKKHIDKQTEALAFRIKEEASEYAQLYEREFVISLIQKLQCRVEAMDHISQYFKEK